MSSHCERLEGSLSEALDQKIHNIRQTLDRDTFVFVPGNDMWELLQGFGAKEEDVFEMVKLWDQAVPQQDEHGVEVYPFKRSLAAYYSSDTTQDHFNVYRSTRYNCVSSPSEIEPNDDSCDTLPKVMECIDLGTANYSNLSYFRSHKALPANTDSNAAWIGLQKFVFAITAQPNAVPWQAVPGTDENSSMLEIMTTLFRVTNSEDLFGEPGPEGIHQDSSELEMIMLVDRKNLTPASGGNRVWSADQPSGKPTQADLTSPRLLGSFTLLDRFDTLLVLDREAKHEALPIVFQADKVAIRDVMTVEVRHPWKNPPEFIPFAG
eukprot:TRINITY_DN94829_c0_g1_i1.p1 TRINITY_DN94829_c0_g1~~TRINITY_DN94829_c0_g1_i1.p1  ORF type:complete len:321 (+),score=48.55 TRINITY_DN94829_c0_g1_i1:153-1115(+)